MSITPPIRNARSRCLVLLSEPPGSQLSKVRQPPAGILGWLTRMQERLTRKISPSAQISSHVRGNRIAEDYLIQSFLGHSQTTDLEFVVPDQRYRDFVEWGTLNPPRRGAAPTRFHTYADLVTPQSTLETPDQCTPCASFASTIFA
jgi:hypothetical protein